MSRLRWLSPALAVVGVLVVAVAVGWAAKARCLADANWTGGEQYRWACYTDVGPIWFGRGLDEGAIPYLDEPLEYPVLTGALLAATAEVTHRLDAERPVVAFFALNGVVNAALALGVLGLLAADGVPARRQLRWAAAPPLVLTLFANWDVLAVAALVLAMVAHRRERHVLAGVAAGVGTAAKLFPALLIPVVVADLVARRRPRRAVVHVAAAAGTWAVLNLPVAVLAPANWWRFFELSRERGPHWASVWVMLDRIGLAGSDGWLNPVATLAFLAGAAVILAVGVRRVPPGRRWMLTLPMVCWFLVVNKVYSPQFSLWVAALVALVAVRSLPVLAFFAVDAAVYVVEYLFLGGRSGFPPSVPYGVLGALAAVRLGVLVWLIVETLRCAAQRQESTESRTSTPRSEMAVPDRTG